MSDTVERTVLLIPFRIKMIRTSTGETRILRDSYGWKGFEPDPEGVWKKNLRFYWAEGNQACDCNRVLSWYRLNGETVPPEFDVDASDCSDGEFQVPYLILDDGEQIWIDEESS